VRQNQAEFAGSRALKRLLSGVQRCPGCEVLQAVTCGVGVQREGVASLRATGVTGGRDSPGKSRRANLAVS
jgi:hypothetical protein